ncbi:hypothetical protein HNY73_001501 [Argiope bruennichi]|uniref:Uncharacterized protein n=1 Tax=Argiope bruennichi TaxID=94029 RepID=A0A8T0G1Y6_ARGBR|nr:hypothetical protein HNY73_001501 [Argiope bruennichi]
MFRWKKVEDIAPNGFLVGCSVKICADIHIYRRWHQMRFCRLETRIFRRLTDFAVLATQQKANISLNVQRNFWNFNKANWASFSDSVDKEISVIPMTGNLNNDWNNLKNIILKYAKACIPRGNVKCYVPCYTKTTAVFEPLLEKRKCLLEASGPVENNRRTAINKINAEIKLTYAHFKRSRWNELCSKLILNSNSNFRKSSRVSARNRFKMKNAIQSGTTTDKSSPTTHQRSMVLPLTINRQADFILQKDKTYFK